MVCNVRYRGQRGADLGDYTRGRWAREVQKTTRISPHASLSQALASSYETRPIDTKGIELQELL